MEKPATNPVLSHVLGAIQDRGAAEAAKIAALTAICNRLDRLQAELEKQTALLDELVERERRA